MSRPHTGSSSDGKNWGSDDLEGLPPTVNIYPWEGPDHFQHIVDFELQRFKENDPERSSQSPCDWIVFSNVSETIFERNFEEEGSDLRKEWKSYNRRCRLLFVEIAMSTREHDEAAETFDDILKEAVSQVGLSNALQNFSDTKIRGDDRAKKPDHGWGPRRPPAGRSRKWPTVVLEVAVSQRKSKLEEDARFWLEQSGGDVKVSLAMAVNRRIPEIVLQKWKISDGKPAMVQKVTVWRRETDILFDNEPLIIDLRICSCEKQTSPGKSTLCSTRGICDVSPRTSGWSRDSWSSLGTGLLRRHRTETRTEVSGPL